MWVNFREGRILDVIDGTTRTLCLCLGVCVGVCGGVYVCVWLKAHRPGSRHVKS